jgi:hypothetical protein
VVAVPCDAAVAEPPSGPLDVPATAPPTMLPLSGTLLGSVIVARASAAAMRVASGMQSVAAYPMARARAASLARAGSVVAVPTVTLQEVTTSATGAGAAADATGPLCGTALLTARSVTAATRPHTPRLPTIRVPPAVRPADA